MRIDVIVTYLAHVQSIEVRILCPHAGCYIRLNRRANPGAPVLIVSNNPLPRGCSTWFQLDRQDWFCEPMVHKTIPGAPGLIVLDNPKQGYSLIGKASCSWQLRWVFKSFWPYNNNTYIYKYYSPSAGIGRQGELKLRWYIP